MIKLSKKHDTIKALFDTLDAELDAKAYAELERTAPGVVSAIVGLVRVGIEPERIRDHVAMRYPQRWIDAQALSQAARHVTRNNELD